MRPLAAGCLRLALLGTICALPFRTVGALVFEDTSPYHHIRVIDQNGLRTLCFDDATESRMSIQDPNQGHFEYTEYFHMAWLWNARITNVLMIGLGGAIGTGLFMGSGIAINPINGTLAVAFQGANGSVQYSSQLLDRKGRLGAPVSAKWRQRWKV